MNKLVLTVGLLCYLTYAVVVRRHFSSATTPGAVRFGIIASCVGLAAFIYLMLRDEYTIAALVASLAIFAACLALFLWTAKTTRSKRLRQAFDPELPGSVVQTGPYRYLRHPFYASYILFWLACIVATSHPLMVIFSRRLRRTLPDRRLPRGARVRDVALRRGVQELSQEHWAVLAKACSDGDATLITFYGFSRI